MSLFEGEKKKNHGLFIFMSMSVMQYSQEQPITTQVLITYAPTIYFLFFILLLAKVTATIGQYIIAESGNSVCSLNSIAFANVVQLT